MDRRYITALFTAPDAAERAVAELAARGVPPDDICVAANEDEELNTLCERTHAVPLEGNVTEQLRETGFSQEHAQRCADALAQGMVLLLVRGPKDARELAQTLQSLGAQTSDEAAVTRVPLRAQRLKVTKRRHTTAQVAIKKVITRSIEHIEVPLESEELVITKTPPGERPEVVRIPLWRDEIDVRKRNVVLNEVAIRRDVRKTVKRITEPVLSEKLVVRQDGSLPGERLDEFAENRGGNTTSLKPYIPMERSMDLQDARGISAYFSDRISAESAVSELQRQGVSPADISLENSGETFLQTMKRLFGGNGSSGPDSGWVVTVSGSHRDVALPILSRFGGRTGSDETADQTVDVDDSGSETDGGRMTLHEERLDVQKHEAKQGEVRLRKQVVTDQKEIDVPVTREEVVLTRQRVEEPDDDATIGQEEEIRIPVMRDEVSVQKHTVATEEVGVQKRDVQSKEHVSATVQKERARLETDGRVGTTLDDER